MIRTVSNILKKLSKESDIVARYGGEEFIILLPNRDLKESASLAEEIRVKIEQKDILQDNNEIVSTSVSIGVTELNYDEDITIEDAILRCDKALYRAKENGKNQVQKL